MTTFIKIGNLRDIAVLSRSGSKLSRVVDLLDNPKITEAGLQMQFAEYLAAVLKARFLDSVRTQRIGTKPMKSLYKPLSRGYALSKSEKNRDKFWVNTGWLTGNLTQWREGNVVRIGFKGHAYYPNTRTRVALVLLWMEKGTRNMPARPLFLPHVKHVKSNMGIYFRHFLKLKYGADV